MKPAPTVRVSRLRLPLLLPLIALAAPLAGRAADASQPAVPDVPTPIISVDENVQKELLSLDRLLDTNPKLEETLRNNVDQLTQEKFRAQNPDVDALLKRRPGLVRALKTEQHYFVHRTVARLAHAKVLRPDAVALDKFLNEHPDIAKALAKRPGQIVDPNFLVAHPELAAFFDKHPALSSVLLQRAEKRQGAKAAAEKK
jgi:hypothetical protein